MERPYRSSSISSTSIYERAQEQEVGITKDSGNGVEGNSASWEEGNGNFGTERHQEPDGMGRSASKGSTYQGSEAHGYDTVRGVDRPPRVAGGRRSFFGNMEISI